MKRYFLLIFCLCIAVSIIMTTSFADTAISEFDILVTEPVPGEKAVFEAKVPQGAGYTVTEVKWIGIFDDGKVFRSDFDYTVQVTVRLADNIEGYITKVPENAKINGQEAKLYNISEDKKQAVISKLFRISGEEEIPYENAVAADEEELAEKDVYDKIVPVFEDVAPDAYYASAVKWAVSENITVGTSQTTFSPEKTCTRAEIITFLWRAVGSPKASPAYKSNPFSDVAATDYFYEAALWALGKGMVTGNEFLGDTPCTRASTVVYLWKNAGGPYAEYENQFDDVNNNSSYAKAVAWAVNENVTAGTSAETFSPDVICTRGQIVTFLNRAIK